MHLLFLDFETQGNEPETTNVTEVGATLLYCHPFIEGEPIELRRFEEKAGLSQLCYQPDEYMPQTPEIVEITGVTDEMLKADGRPPDRVFVEQLFPLVEQADWVLAHKKSFDQVVYESTCRRLGLTPAEPKSGWICTLTEVPYPDRYRCKQLSHLAYDHGVIVHPDKLHRAKNDVDLLAQFITTKYKIEDIIKFRNTPWAYLRACIPPPWEDGGKGKELAKGIGYGFEKARGTEAPSFPKMWVKRVKETEIEKEKRLAPFKITRLVPQGEQI